MELAPRSPSSIERAVRQIAGDQFGVFSRRQALSAGVTTASISRRLGEGLWQSILPSVYRIAGAPESNQQSALAAVLWAGKGALVSHAAAAKLWAIDALPTRRVELWVPEDRRPRSPVVTVHRGTRLDRADRTLLGPIPITTPVRTLIDIAERLEDDRLLAVMEDVFRRDLGTPERLRARLDALGGSGRVGSGRLGRLLDERGDARPLESRLEARVWLLIQRSGVPLPVRQHWVAVPSGRYRLDFAWPELKLGLECDGWAHHGDRSAFRSDRARLAELAALRWRVVPITWDAATRESERVIQWIQTAHAQAA